MTVVNQALPVNSLNARQLINRAYSLLGYLAAGETLTSDDAVYGLNALNSMIDGWNTQSLYVPSVNEFVSTIGPNPVTIGPSMTINLPRPVWIFQGTFVRVNGVDYPIWWIDREQYNDIAVKAVTSPIPCYAYYDGNFPTGNIFFWPNPQAGTELHLQLPQILAQFVDLDTYYSFIPGYQNALEYTLAQELAPGIKSLPPEVAMRAKMARKFIRRTNADIPTMNVGTPNGSPYAQFIAGL